MGLMRGKFDNGEEIRRTNVLPQVRLPRPGEFERGAVIPIDKQKKFSEDFYRSNTEFREKRTEKKTLVVGLGGKARHGKDTVAEHLIKLFGNADPTCQVSLDIRSYGFADALKVEVFDFFHGYEFLCNAGLFICEKSNIKEIAWTKEGFTLPFSGDNYSREGKLEWANRNKSGLRPFLQKWGTEFRRAQNENYWIEKTKRQIKEERPQVALIRDLRFANEAAICDVTVKVERLGYVEQDENVGKHVSEVELDSIPFDYTISVPDGQLGLLKSEAEAVFKRILSKWI